MVQGINAMMLDLLKDLHDMPAKITIRTGLRPWTKKRIRLPGAIGAARRLAFV